jgi:uncharacterized protein (TIGR02301 family)
MKAPLGRGVLMVLTLATLLVGADAQTKVAPPAPAAPPAEAVPPPPYEPQLLRLSEILGSLAFLRDLCGLKDGDKFRAKMAELLEVEAKTEKRKDMLAGAFNRGFRGYEVIYRSCTPAADSVIGRYLNEAERLAHDLTNRFGGG